jgi:hypothetical protein
MHYQLRCSPEMWTQVRISCFFLPIWLSSGLGFSWAIYRRKPRRVEGHTVPNKNIGESSATMSHRRCKAAAHGPAGVRRRRRKLLLTHPLDLRRGRHPTPIRKRIFLPNPCFSPFWSRGSRGVFLNPFCLWSRCGVVMVSRE